MEVHLLADLVWVDFDFGTSTFCLVKLAELAVWLGKMVEHPKSKSTEPSPPSPRTWYPLIYQGCISDSLFSGIPHIWITTLLDNSGTMSPSWFTLLLPSEITCQNSRRRYLRSLAWHHRWIKWGLNGGAWPDLLLGVIYNLWAPHPSSSLSPILKWSSQ